MLNNKIRSALLNQTLTLMSIIETAVRNTQVLAQHPQPPEPCSKQLRYMHKTKTHTCPSQCLTLWEITYRVGGRAVERVEPCDRGQECCGFQY